MGRSIIDWIFGYLRSTTIIFIVGILCLMLLVKFTEAEKGIMTAIKSPSTFPIILTIGVVFYGYYMLWKAKNNSLN